MNRSEELCKLLGIEPKTTCSEYHTCEEYCSKEQDGRRVPLCINVKDNCYNGECYKLVYPDLTTPSNFVKLLEDIKIDGIELCDWLICYSGSFCNRQDFIDSLIALINEYATVICCLTQDIKILKQQAQQTEWEY